MTVSSCHVGRLLLLVVFMTPSLSMQEVLSRAGNGQPGTHKHSTADSSFVLSSWPKYTRQVLSRKPRSASLTPTVDNLPATSLDQATASWSQVPFGPKKIGSIPFHSFRINVYNGTSNKNPDSHNRYFYAPVRFLNVNDTHCTSNDDNHVGSAHEVTFSLTMWNNESQLAVRQYLDDLVCKNHASTATLPVGEFGVTAAKANFESLCRTHTTAKPMGCPIMEESVEVIPFEQVKVLEVNSESANKFYGCTIDSIWKPYQAQRVKDFTMRCPNRNECQSLAMAIKEKPDGFANHFQVALRLTSVSNGSRIRKIRMTRLIETNKLAAAIDQHFKSRERKIKRALLTLDIHRDLVQGAATSIMLDTFDNLEDLVDNDTHTSVVQIVERFLKSSVMWITGATAKTAWESVFWINDNYRPDKTAARINEIHKNLDAEDKRRLEEAMSNNSNVSGETEISVKAEGSMLLGISGEASYIGSFGTDHSNSSSKTNTEFTKLLAESKKNLKWDGEKFVPKDLELVGITLTRLSDTKSLSNQTVQVPYAPGSVLTLPINLPQPAPTSCDCADAIEAAERAWSLKINATVQTQPAGHHQGCSEGIKMQNSGSKSTQQPLPSPSFPAGLAWWKLAWPENWKELEDGLEPVGFRKFWVTDPASELHLAGIRDQFDRKQRSPDYNETALNILPKPNGGDNAELAGKLLALGVDPDLETTESWRAAHSCGNWARPNLARTLSRCRPSLTAKNGNGRTPLQAARRIYAPGPYEHLFPETEIRKIRSEVARVWEEVEKNGFPSIAKLAYSTEWAPLQNLCRRRVISAEEAEEKYAGRTAVEWAEFYRESDLAAELRYLLAPPTTEVAAKLETLGYKLAAQSSHP